MPSSPMRKRCGTRTLSKCSCAVSDEFMPAFFSLRATSTPWVFIGTQISVLLRCADPPSLVLGEHAAPSRPGCRWWSTSCRR